MNRALLVDGPFHVHGVPHLARGQPSAPGKRAQLLGRQDRDLADEFLAHDGVVWIHHIMIGGRLSADQGFPQARHRIDHQPIMAPGDGIRAEQNACRLGGNHGLHDNTHGLRTVATSLMTVGPSRMAGERAHAAGNRLAQIGLALNIQKGLELPGERRVLAIFPQGRRANGHPASPDRTVVIQQISGENINPGVENHECLGNREPHPNQMGEPFGLPAHRPTAGAVEDPIQGHDLGPMGAGFRH